MSRIFLLLFVLLASIGPANAQTFPALSGRVVDEANLLDPAQEAALTAKLQALETATNRQLVVTTLNSLQGYDIADYGYQLGRKWAIGQDGKGEAEKDNGTILIVAPKERKMRIEVGYGLEPVLTDGYSSSIIRNTITPFFKAGDYATRSSPRSNCLPKKPPRSRRRRQNPVGKAKAGSISARSSSGCLSFSSSSCLCSAR
jgi:uncharacterized protein